MVLAPLVDILREARLNLIIYNLKNGQVREAEDMLRHVYPVSPEVGWWCKN